MYLSTFLLAIPLMFSNCIFSVAAGQNTTFFLAKPNSKLSDLPRHPIDVHPSPECVACGIDDGDDDDALQCDKVRTSAFS
jgi:hypothetical protein